MNPNRIRYYLHNLEALRFETEQLKQEYEDYCKLQVEYFILAVPGGDDNVGSQHSKYSSKSMVENIAIPRLEYMQKVQNKIFLNNSIVRSIDIVLNRYKGDSSIMFLVHNKYPTDRGKRPMSIRAIGQKLGYSFEWVVKWDKRLIREINMEILSRLEGKG